MAQARFLFELRLLVEAGDVEEAAKKVAYTLASDDEFTLRYLDMETGMSGNVLMDVGAVAESLLLEDLENAPEELNMDELLPQQEIAHRRLN